MNCGLSCQSRQEDFKPLSAHGFFIRHARGIELSNIQVEFTKEELRPAFYLEDVKEVDFRLVNARKAGGALTFVLKAVENFGAFQCANVPDTRLSAVAKKEF